MNKFVTIILCAVLLLPSIVIADKDILFYRSLIKSIFKSPDDVEIYFPDLDEGLISADPEIRELSYGGLTTISTLSSKRSLIPLNERRLQLVLDGLSSENERIRRYSIQIVAYSFSSEESSFNVLAERVDKEESDSILGVLVLVMEKYKDLYPDKMEEILIKQLSSGESSAIKSAMVLSRYKEPPIAALPHLIKLLRSEKYFANNFVIDAIVNYGEDASIYLDEIKEVSKRLEAGAEFIQHKGLLMRKLTGLISQIDNSMGDKKI